MSAGCFAPCAIRMPGFAEENLSDEELGLILAYLSHMADRKIRATEGGSSNAK